MCKKTKGCGRRIDPCMKTMMQLLNIYMRRSEVQTIASCCGHGKYPMTILVKGKPSKFIRNPFDKPIVQDLISGKIIPRKARFYKKDKQGYYYIPEVCKEIK